MKVRMRTTYAGPRGTILAGQVADLPPKDARELLNAGFAEPVKDEPAETAAMQPAPETTDAAPKAQKKPESKRAGLRDRLNRRGKKGQKAAAT